MNNSNNLETISFRINVNGDENRYNIPQEIQVLFSFRSWFCYIFDYIISWNILEFSQSLMYIIFYNLNCHMPRFYFLSIFNIFYFRIIKHLGCIDGTFIVITASNENEPDYVNRKEFQSLNIQVKFSMEKK